MELTEKTWPVGFYGPISKKVITMDVTRKHVKIGAANMFNTTLLFSRVIGLQASSRETIDIRNLLSYELAPVPTSMFTDSGDMRIGKSKSQLKTQLQVELSTRKASVVVVCLPRPMEGMGRLKFSDRFFPTELPVPPQAAGVVGTFNVLDIYPSEHYGLSFFGPYGCLFFLLFFCIHFHFASTLCMCVMYLTSI